jgi:hypothetical protein
VDIERRRLQRRGVRDFVSGFECFRRGDYLYRADDGAVTGSGDVNRQVRDRYDQIGRSGHHRYASTSAGGYGKSNNSVGADEQDAEHCRNGEQ